MGHGTGDDMTHSSLGDRLQQQINANGPLSLANYMAACLGDPDHGYYQQQTPFGIDGDFITAPEISGMFGEMCGLYLAHMFELSQPALPAIDDSVITELGPGRGTLMRDMQHVWTQLMPAMRTHPVHFVETSQKLRDQQADIMAEHDGKMTWHDAADGLPDAPLFGIANEFFDALPIDQFIYRKGGWHHRLVGVDEDAGGLCFTDGPIADDALQNQLSGPKPASDGDIAELCPAADAVMDQLAQRVARYGGAILIVDYGQAGNRGDSLQAVADHKPVDPFFEPGRADLSHWVDFDALGKRASMAGARLIGPVPQGRFLMRIGLAARAEQAAATAEAEMRRALLAAIDRLTSPAQMGEAFKVALLVPDGTGTPPGFEIE